MKKYKYNFILIFIILFSIIFISSCHKNEETNNDDEIVYYDSLGYKRPKEGIYSECLVLNHHNYYEYKNKLFGDSGESGLVNNTILNFYNYKLDVGKYYFVYLFYGNGNINLDTYFKLSLINETGILFDNDAVSFEDVTCVNYKIENRIQTKVNVSFDITKEPFERFIIDYDKNDIDYMLFSVVLPFNINEKGILDINFRVSDYDNNYELKKDIDLNIDTNINESALASVNDYSISFISESLCENGIIDDNKLSNKPNFVRNFSKLMVVDFEIESLIDNDGENFINVFAYVPNLEKFYASIEDVPTTKFSENVINDHKIMKVSLDIPRNKNEKKKYRIVYKFITYLDEFSDIDVVLYSNNINRKDCKHDSFVVETNSGLEFVQSDDVFKVKASNKEINEITIPRLYNGKEVEIDVNAFENCVNLTDVIIEDGVKIIEANAFKNCTALKSIIIPNTLTYVGEEAFEGCQSDLFNQNDNGIYIGNENNKNFIFLKTLSDNLSSFYLNPNAKIIASGAFANNTYLSNVNLFNVEYIGVHSFDNCTALKEITIPNTVKEIRVAAFHNCSNLGKITLPFIGFKRCEKTDEEQYQFGFIFGKYIHIINDNTIVQDHSTYVPSSLKTVVITDSKYLPNKAFYNCTGIENLSINDKTKEVGNSVFSNCKIIKADIPLSILNQIPKANLKEVNIINGDIIEDYALKDSYLLEKITIPNSIKIIGNNAFENCSSLEEIIITNSIEKIGNNAFRNCNNLLKIEIPSTVAEIGVGAFKNCNKLTEMSLPYVGKTKENSSTIDYLFMSDEYDTSYTLPNINTLILTDTKTIIANALNNLKNLKTIELPKSINFIGKSAFPVNIESVYYDGTINDWIKIEFENNYSNPMAHGDAKYFYLKDTVGETIFNNAHFKLLTDLIIPASVGEIGFQFYSFKSLKTIVIEEGVTSIGVLAFNGCISLESIIIPNSVNYIGQSILSQCYNIKSITLPFVGEKRYKQSAENQYPFGYIFGEFGHGSTQEFISSDSEVKKYQIPSSLRYVTITDSSYIQPCAFSNCSRIEEINLSSCLKKIEANVFVGCDGLTRINYFGNMDNWCDIEFTNENSNPMNYANDLYLKNGNSFNKIEEITLSNTTKIGDYQFLGFENIKNIYLSNTLLSIGKKAFYNCKLLNNITVPNSVLNIAEGAFNGCPKLEKITLPFIGDKRHALSDENQYPLGYIFGTENYDNYKEVVQYYNVQESKTYYIPSGLSEVIMTNCDNLSYGAFYNCDFITNIELPNDLINIDIYAFYNCNLIEKIELPVSISSIKDDAFSNCSSLEKVYYDGNIDDWCGIAFSNEKSNPMYYANSFYINNNGYELITELNINDNIDKVGNYQFYGFENIKNIYISESVKLLGEYAFAYCKGIKDIIIPNNVKNIEFGVFSGCSNLEKMTLPFVGNERHGESDTNQYPFGYIFGSIKYDNSIAKNQYYFGSSTNSKVSSLYYIPSNLFQIIITDSYYLPSGAFYNCDLLTSIILPNSLMNLGDSSLNSCSGLERIELPANLSKINSRAFYNCNKLENVYYNNSINNWCNIEFVDADSNPMSKADNFYILNDNNYELINELTIGNEISEIGNYQFYGFENVNSLSLPNSITKIGKNAFGNCASLINLIIPNSVLNIVEGAFLNCDNLESISLPFIGDKRHEEDDLYQYPLGYIFGQRGNVVIINGENKPYTTQYYYGNSKEEIVSTRYGIPSKLKEIIITDSAYMPYGALSGISNIEKLSIPFVGDKNHNEDDLNQYPLGYIFGETNYNGSYSATQYYYGESKEELSSKTYYIPIKLKELYIDDTNYMPYGALSGISSIEKLSIPFVGNMRHEKPERYQYPLGYIFGENEYDGSIAADQGYYDENGNYVLKKYYVPSNLIKISIYNALTIPHSAFAGLKNVLTIELSNDITYIGYGAFSGCDSLINVNIPTELNILEQNLFSNCKSLINIEIPKNIVEISYSAFSGCSNLTSVYYDGTTEDWCNIDFYGYAANPMCFASYFYMLNSNGTFKFNNNDYELISEINIPNTITEIKKYQFYKFDTITIINIPNSITSIGDKALAYCTSLISLEIPESTIYLSSTAFDNISEDIFNEYENCLYLGSENNKYLRLMKPLDTNIETLIINPNTKIIASGAFLNCNSLTDFVIPNSVTTIGKSAFSGCKSLTNVTIPSSVIAIGSGAFSGCSLIENITISNGVETIGDSAFSGLSKIKTIELPESLITVGDYAFANCTSLEIIIYSGCHASFGVYLYNYCTTKKDFYYNGTIENLCKIRYKDYTSSPLYYYGNDFYILDENGIAEYNGNNYSYLEELVIPDSINELGEYQFTYINTLKKVTLNENIQKLTHTAFNGCPIEEINVLDSVVDFDERIFVSISSNVHYNYYFNSSIEEWLKKSFDDDRSNPMCYCNYFYFLDNDGDVIFNNKKYKLLEEIQIPNNIESINKYQFYGFENVINLEIPLSVKTIDMDAFKNCKSLTNVYYDGTVEEWGEISFVNSYSNPMYYGNYLFVLDINGDVVYNDKKYKLFEDVIISPGTEIIEQCQFKNLKNIEIPSSVNFIKANAFYNNKSLTNVYYDGTIEDWCKITFENPYSNPMYYGSNFYIYDENGDVNFNDNNYSLITKIIIPNTIETIGNYQFYNFEQLLSIHISDGVTNICSYGFFNCKYMTIIELPITIKTIEKYAFMDCESLTNIYYDGTVENWCDITFEDSYSNPMCYGKNFYSIDNSGDVEFEGNKYVLLKELLIPDSINKIGNYQFYNFNQLIKVEIADTVKNIGSYAFYKCKSINSIEIPNSITSIGSGSFSNCTSLINVNLSDNLSIIGYEAFYNCSSLNYIEIPNSVTSIDLYSFKNCPIKKAIIPALACACINNNKLAEVVITSGTSINGNAFYHCSSLYKVTLPQTLIEIGSGAFDFCDKLFEIYNLSSLEIIKGDSSNGNIGLYALKIHSSLDEESILIYDNDYTFAYVDDLGYLVEYKGNASDIVLPESFEYNNKIINKYVINSRLFYNNLSLISVKLLNSIIGIGDYAFYNCKNLNNIELSNELIYIGDYAFQNCSSLINIDLPTSLENIGNVAFENCSSINNIIIPDGIKEIGYRTFEACSSLQKIILPSSLTSIGNAAFTSCYKLVEVYNLSSLSIVKGTESNGKIGLNALKIHTSLDEASILVKKDGYLFAYTDECGYLLGYEGKNNELILPDSFVYNNKTVNEYIINQRAFYNYDFLRSLEMHNNIASIGECAFYNCKSLIEIKLSNALTTIDRNAFYNCSVLNNLRLSSSLIRIGLSAFEKCSSLENIYYDGTIDDWCDITFLNSYSNPMCYGKKFYLFDIDGDIEYGSNNYILLTNLTLSNEVQNINNYQFYNFEQLKCVEISSSIKKIGSYSFSKCSSLEIVNYNGTEEEWNKITIKVGNDYLINATIIYDYTGE